MPDQIDPAEKADDKRDADDVTGVEIGHRIGDGLSSLILLRDLRSSEERWRSLTMSSPDHIMLLDCDGTIRFINHTVPDLSIEQVLGTTVFDYTPEKFHRVMAVCFKQVAESQRPGRYETDYHTSEGEIRHFETRVAPVLGRGETDRGETDRGETVALILSARDVTESKRAEKQLAASLREKEVLLREIHHRVKNNMQVIVSLLRMHARRSPSDQVRDVFAECRNRVNAMALIHQALYESEDLARIDFEAYLAKLCRDLSRAYSFTGKGITVTVGRDVTLGMDQSIAVGMVVCELVSNAFKHAFPEGREGSVAISMCGLDCGQIELIVEDDGPGLPPEIDLHNPPSLGLDLVVSGVRRELGGSIEVERGGGTRFVIRIECENA